MKSFLFLRQSTAVMMMMMTVTTAMGASTAAMIHRLLGGFFTTAAGKSQREARDKEHWEWGGNPEINPPQSQVTRWVRGFKVRKALALGKLLKVSKPPFSHL